MGGVAYGIWVYSRWPSCVLPIWMRVVYEGPCLIQTMVSDGTAMRMEYKTNLRWTCERFVWYAPLRVVVEGSLLLVVVVRDEGATGRNINQRRLLCKRFGDVKWSQTNSARFDRVRHVIPGAKGSFIDNLFNLSRIYKT